MYRKRSMECSARLKLRANQRAVKERKRLEGVAPEYPAELPELRRMVIVIDFDFGRHVEVFRFWKTRRVDCYRMTRKDGKVIDESIGWARALEKIRKGYARVRSSRGLC